MASCEKERSWTPITKYNINQRVAAILKMIVQAGVGFRVEGTRNNGASPFVFGFGDLNIFTAAATSVEITQTQWAQLIYRGW